MSELLGTIIAPSGIVLVYDVGRMGWWRRFDRSPRDEKCVDLELLGRDASRARELWRTATGRIHDVPVSAAEADIRRLARKFGETGIRVTLEPRPVMAPLKRCRAIVGDAPAGHGLFGGLDGAVVRGAPRGELEVRAVRRDDGRWERVSVVCRAGGVARSSSAGFCSVDFARLFFADPTLLDLWQHDEPLDGKADFVFWGRDAEAVAERFGAPKTEEGWGWLDLPIGELLARGGPVEAWREAHPRLKYVTDFRPHSHHFELMRQIRTTATSSGTVELGRGRVCGFHTSWGDGAFPVWCDFDSRGRLLAVHVHLAPPPSIGG